MNMTTPLSDLLGSAVLSEEVRENINTAWEKQIAESREEITAELREEFASRYEHDKSQLVEAMDKLISDTITSSSEEFKKLHNEAIDQRVKYASQVKEHSELLQKFVMETLTKEISELRNDREAKKETLANLEEFALRKLTKEISELNEDHQKLVDARVKLVSEGRKAIEETKAQFIKKASEKVNALVTESFKKEMSDLKEDIREAKENNFGRKIMEAFAAEFMASKFADGSAVSELNRKVNEIQTQLEESAKIIAGKDVEIIEASKRQRIAEDQVARIRVMGELCAPLSKDKRAIMEELLESTETKKLKESFQKYLPSVLNEEVRRDKKTLVEGTQSQKTVVTGNKEASVAQVEESVDDETTSTIANLRKLAGIKN
jgi:hypothetical protein